MNKCFVCKMRADKPYIAWHFPKKYRIGRLGETLDASLNGKILCKDCLDDEERKLCSTQSNT